jgi:hypothetical protein
LSGWFSETLTTRQPSAEKQLSPEGKAMNSKRKMKIRKREKKEQRANTRRREEILDSLESLGLRAPFEALPERIKVLAQKNVLPKPEIVCQPGAETAQEEIAEWFEENLKVITPADEGCPYAASFFDLFCVLEGFRLFFWEFESLIPANARRHNLPQEIETVLSFKRHLDKFEENDFFLVARPVLLQLFDQAIVRSFPTDKIFWWGMILHRPTGKPRWQFKLQWTEPESRTITIDGIPRAVFPCFRLDPHGSLHPIQWTTEALGLGPDSRTLAVYIQRHAAEHWKRRLPPEFVDYLVFCRSLAEPVVEHGKNGAILVAYRVGNVRLGYFVCEVVDDLAVIRTFLFPTMQGTPESELLRQKLRLRRADIEVNQLDQVETFMASDLRRDPELAGIFSECGLGHLLEDVPVLDDVMPRSGVAASLRKYLGFKPAQQGNAASPRENEPETRAGEKT